MKQYIDKDAAVAEIERRIKVLNEKLIKHPISSPTLEKLIEENKKVLSLLDTLEVKEVDNIWHSIDDIPDYNLNGISDFIVDSCYGHIYGEAHSYTPQQWSAHLGFVENREFKWAYEKDLINFE